MGYTMGMQTHISSFARNLKVLLVGAACVVSSFAVGIQTAGDIHPITLIQAGSAELPGDMDQNGVVDLHDVRIILEISQDYREATAQQARNDPNGDGLLTVDDALRLLAELAF